MPFKKGNPNPLKPLDLITKGIWLESLPPGVLDLLKRNTEKLYKAAFRQGLHKGLSEKYKNPFKSKKPCL